jgi:hypothetical protein
MTNAEGWGLEEADLVFLDRSIAVFYLYEKRSGMLGVDV